MAPIFLVIAGLSIGVLVMLLNYLPTFRHQFAGLTNTPRPETIRNSTWGLADDHLDRAMSSALTTAIVATALGVLLMLAVIVRLVQ